MAIRFTRASSQYIARTTGTLLEGNSTYTIMCWTMIVTDPNDYQSLVSIGDSGGNYQDFLQCKGDGTTLQIASWTSPNFVESTGVALTLSTWYHVAMVRESTTSLKFYFNGALQDTITQASSGRAAAAFNDMGRTNSGSGGVGEYWGGRVDAIKSWTAALTLAEVAQEMNTKLPVRYANLLQFCPTWPGASERVLDYSGNGANWTAFNTPTDEDPPPVSYGAPVWAVGKPTSGAAPSTSFNFPHRPLRLWTKRR